MKALGSKLLASWPDPCSLAGQTLSPLGVCPARLVPVRVAGSLVSKLYVPRPAISLKRRKIIYVSSRPWYVQLADQRVSNMPISAKHKGNSILT